MAVSLAGLESLFSLLMAHLARVVVKKYKKKGVPKSALADGKFIEVKNSKGKKKKANAPKKDVEPDQEGVNKNDSREGIRAYARGRAYVPNRFDGVTEYVDPNERILAEAMAQSKKKKKEKAAPAQEEAKPAPVEETVAAVEETVLPVEEPAAPAAETAEVETVEVEVEVEEIEVEVDEDKEGV